MSEDPERLGEEQQERARREEELADRSDSEEERLAHERRSDKAEYLRDKLREQAEAADEE